jgi:hypothetical protein
MPSMSATTWETGDSAVPVDLGAVYSRLDRHLRTKYNRALLAVEQPKSSALALSRYSIYEAELKSGGKVTRINLEARAREEGVLEPFERPLEHYQTAPPS